MLTEAVDVLVIGGGPAGLAAALAARSAGAGSVLIVEREAELGGILRQCIHTGFGLHRFKAELSGPEYARRDMDRLAASGVSWRCGTMVLSLSSGRLAETISPEEGVRLIQAGSVVLAMGCRERPCGALGIPGTHCAGILSAGTAQSLVNLKGLMPGRRVVILGSGDIGLIMARRMTCEGAQVLACVEIMPFSSGLRRNIVQCLDDFGIPLLLSHTIVGIEGRERLEAVIIARVDAQRRPVPGSERRLECDSLLLSVGLIPEIELARQAGLDLSAATGGPRVDQWLEASAPGVFACGNVLHVHDLVDEVSAEGELAGRQAARFAAGASASASTFASASASTFASASASTSRSLAGSTRDPAVNRVERTLSVDAGPGVQGVVPQIIRFADDGRAIEPIRVSFRPTGVFCPARVTILAGETRLIEQKRRILTPGEQTSVTLSVETLATLAADPNLGSLRITAASTEAGNREGGGQT